MPDACYSGAPCVCCVTVPHYIAAVDSSKILQYSQTHDFTYAVAGAAPIMCPAPSSGLGATSLNSIPGCKVSSHIPLLATPILTFPVTPLLLLMLTIDPVTAAALVTPSVGTAQSKLWPAWLMALCTVSPKLPVLKTVPGTLHAPLCALCILCPSSWSVSDEKAAWRVWLLMSPGPALVL